MSQRGGRGAMAMTRRALVLRTSYLVLPLVFALTLGACGFSTDTVATVGGERITRGELNAALARQYPERDRARYAPQVLRSLIDMRVVELEARAQKIVVTESEISAGIDSQVAAVEQQFGSPVVSGADIFQQFLLSEGFTSAVSYRDYVRDRMLKEKMRDSWYQAQVDFVTTKVLFTDSMQQAQEAIQKGRGGTSFDEILRTYGSPVVDPRAVDQLGSVPVEWLRQSILGSAFTAGIGQGAYSDPLPNGQQYIVIYISAAERRAPTADEEGLLVASWVNKLKVEKYRPSIADPALATASTR